MTDPRFTDPLLSDPMTRRDVWRTSGRDENVGGMMELGFPCLAAAAGRRPDLCRLERSLNRPIIHEMWGPALQAPVPHE